MVRVLLLDDEPMVLLDLEMAVEDAGGHPVSAISLEEAIAHMEGERPFDVGILDVTLGPQTTCLPIAKIFQEKSVPYLLYTGDLDRQNEVVRELDAEIVPKPTPASEVVKRALSLLAAND